MKFRITKYDLTIFGIIVAWADYFAKFNGSSNRRVKFFNRLVIFSGKFEITIFETKPRLKIFDFWIINKFRYILYHSGKFHFKIYR